MFKKISHATGMQVDEEEILFLTPFNYLFPEAARSPLCLLPPSPDTVTGLQDLANAMADQSIASPDPNDSDIPAIMTYLGQFIDHDLTARTDRESALTAINNPSLVAPNNPDEIIKKIHNGRRPQLDLDSVFGEGPGLVPGVETQSQPLYDENFKLRVFEKQGRIDLPRDPDTHIALIGDARNDENFNISQLHTLFLKFYNRVYDSMQGNPTKQQRYVRARQLTRWAYQFVVVNDFLLSVCDAGIVRDTMANGPRFYGYGLDQSQNYIPLEFSVAAFRFGHTLIRPQYKLNNVSDKVLLINMDGPTALQLLGINQREENFSSDGHLKPEFIIEWKNFIGDTAQRTRRFDSKIAMGLFTLPFRNQPPILSHLAKSNLLRGYSFSLPTAQACCEVMGIKPLTPTELAENESPAIAAILQNPVYSFGTRTPLWYYILREGAVQQNGARLGELGSRIVAETIVGLIKNDPNSYRNNRHDPALTQSDRVVVGPGASGNIKNLHDFLVYAGAPGL